MDTISAIKERRSVKYFDPSHKMTEQELAQLIELAKLTPSSFNMQNYRFVIVRDSELRKEIRAAAWDQAQVTDASVMILMCADLNAHIKDPKRYWSHAPQAVQDILVPALTPFYADKPQLIRDEAMRTTGLAGMTIMLAAKAMGYDSCPMVGFDPVAVSKLINIPEGYVLSFMIAVGKSIKPAWPRGERLSDQEVVIYDKF